jgi:hypothetical protein
VPDARVTRISNCDLQDYLLPVDADVGEVQVIWCRKPAA